MKRDIRIMIADDDVGIVDSIKMMLHYKGYDVTAATEKVLPKILAEMPDILLLDIWMSGEDGNEICRILKSRPDTSKIAVLIISASREIERSAVGSGADDFLPKPFEMEELLNKIEVLRSKLQ